MSCSSPPGWLFRHASSSPEAPALDAPGTRLGYGALAARVGALAGSLAARGVRPTDRVVVALPFSPAAAVSTLAVQALGACAIEIDRAMGASGFAEVVAQAHPRFAIVHAADAPAWAQATGPLAFAWAWSLPGPAPSLPAEGRTTLRADASLPPGEPVAGIPGAAGVSPGDPALVVFTSGSTGRPRGVIQTYGNIEANTRSIVEYLRLTRDDRALAVLPFHYCYGKSVLQTHLLAGGSVFVEPRFMYPRTAMESLGREGCTGFAGVPASFEILRREVDVAALSRPRLRYLTQAGGRMHPDTVRWARRAFAPAELFVMYGQTEATARLAYLPPDRAGEKEGSIGIAIPGVELSVVDEQAVPVAVGEAGHLVARGDNVTPGYLEDPEETSAILHHGWLWTGDLARRDADGYFFLVGRAREILKVGGYRVSPVEIEDTLRAHPAVADAAVVGVPDAVLGEVPVAFVELAPAEETVCDGMEGALRRLCKNRLAGYKVPLRVLTLDHLPRTSSGKPQKSRLLDAARESARSSPPGRKP